MAGANDGARSEDPSYDIVGRGRADEEQGDEMEARWRWNMGEMDDRGTMESQGGREEEEVFVELMILGGVICDT